MNFKYKSEVSKMIALLRLVNIQSFKDITLDLTRGINVIEAPNETGKSVMFKVYRTMCDANWYGRGERKSLIRRGCSKGLALLVVPKSENEVYKVLFEVYKTYQVYRLYLNDKLLDSWKQDVLPQRVQEVLGWYYDSNSKILLNLCDQELDMPFVNSNSRFNYEVMRFIIQSPELERARDNLHEWIKNCTDDLNNLHKEYPISHQFMGHIHFRANFQKNRTKFISNSLGYRREWRSRDFTKELLDSLYILDLNEK